MSRSLGYRLEVPIDEREARRRRLEAGLARILVWAPEVSIRVGYLQVPEDLLEVIFNACATEGGVFTQPLNSHVVLADYGQKLAERQAVYGFYPSGPNRSTAKVLTVRCTQLAHLAASVTIFQCETIAIFPAVDSWPTEELLESISKPIPDNQWASAYLQHVRSYGMFGFLSHGHDNAEILGRRSRILETFGNLVTKYEASNRG